MPTLSGVQESSEKKYNRSREGGKTNVSQIKAGGYSLINLKEIELDLERLWR